ncbi:MAG: NADH-quinone oxidoreductase subunit J [Anaerolineaceae bacterium]|nr:NADH-quinone oxidoreductase subunit J [Anaerolineaceae bacterium]
MLITYLIFGVFGLVVAASALGMLLSRNAVYSALFLVLNFATVAVLYLILGAPFIALVQITVYAGSIMVLFLFVIMLLGAEKMPPGEPLRGHRWLAIVFGLVFLAELVLFLIYRGGMQAVVNAPSLEFGSPAAVGMMLFQKYTLPFEVTGFILVVATVGAILFTRGEGFKSRKRTLGITSGDKAE